MRLYGLMIGKNPKKAFFSALLKEIEDAKSSGVSHHRSSAQLTGVGDKISNSGAAREKET